MVNVISSNGYNWFFEIGSLLNIQQYFLPVSLFHNKRKSHGRNDFLKLEQLEDKDGSRSGDTNKISEICKLEYLLAFWFVTYAVYQKYLHGQLRNQGFGLLKRNRVIWATWNCLFAFAVILLKIFYNNLEITDDNSVTFLYLILQTFYIHNAVIETVSHWGPSCGLTRYLFAVCLVNPWRWTEESTRNLLFYQAWSSIFLYACQILVSLRPRQKLPSTLLFFCHFVISIYLHVFYIPEKFRDIVSFEIRGPFELCLKIWYILEYLNSSWMKLIFRGMSFSDFNLEDSYIFPPLSQEAIELSNIYKRHLVPPRERPERKAELWQTMLCAMAIKRKVKRLRRKAAEANNNINSHP